MYSLQFQELIENALLSIVYLLLAYIIGVVFSKKLQEFLKKIIKMRIIKKHVNENSMYKIIEFISVFSKYFIYFLGLIFALNQLNIKSVNEIIHNLINYSPNILVSGLFIVIGIMLANLSKKIIKITLTSTEIDELFSDLEPKLSPSNFFGVMVQYIILIISITVALSQLGLQTQLLSWLALSITTIITIFMFLFVYSGIKPYLPDFISGIIIRNKKYLRVGEYIEINGIKYRVLGLGIIHTKLENNGNLSVMKNSEIITKFKRKI